MMLPTSSALPVSKFLHISRISGFIIIVSPPLKSPFWDRDKTKAIGPWVESVWKFCPSPPVYMDVHGGDIAVKPIEFASKTRSSIRML